PGLAPAVLPRDQLPGDRDDLPGLPVRPPVRDPSVRDVLHLRCARRPGPDIPARFGVQQQSALAVGRSEPGEGARARPAQQMSARNRELIGLIPASLLVTAGFAGVFIQRSNQLSNLSLTYGLIFLGLCVAAHFFIRFTLPNADPYLFPLVTVLASFGIVMIYRIDST